MVCMCVLVNSHFAENLSMWSCMTPIFLRWGCYTGRAAASSRSRPSVGTWALGARALITATSATSTSSAKYISLDKLNNIDSKCPLADNLQLALWLRQYRVAPPPKYYRESFCGDQITLAKSFIISLENVVANWYARLPPRSITSWA
jgi:hypothetical protein